MRDSLDGAPFEKLETNLRDSLDRLAPHPNDAQALLQVESTIEMLYALADGEPAALRRLGASLSPHSARHDAVDAWTRLADLALPDAKTDEVLSRLALPLSRAPHWTRLLVGIEAARIVASRRGSHAAWPCVVAIDAVGAMRALSPLNDIQRDSLMLGGAVCVALDLAGQQRQWAAHDALAEAARTLWGRATVARARVELVVADTRIARGEYVACLRILDSIADIVHGHVRLHWLCTRLHALIALGRAPASGRCASSVEDTLAAETLAKFRKAAREPVESKDRLPAEDVGRLCERVEAIVATSRGLASTDEERDGTHGRRPPGDRPAEGYVRRLHEVLSRERRVRERQNRKTRYVELQQMRRDVEDMLVEKEVWLNPSDAIRLRLLWCRLLVDLGGAELCAAALDDGIDQLGNEGPGNEGIPADPLLMLALDQRAVLRTRRDTALEVFDSDDESPNPAERHRAVRLPASFDWKGALFDSQRAAEIAERILRANTCDGDIDGERSLLASLLPVFDRGIEVLIEGALASRSAGRAERSARDPAFEASRASWNRFGKSVHRYAEQMQQLALHEARHAREQRRDPRTYFCLVDAHDGFAGTPEIDALRGRLRPHDAVLQYLIVSGYILVFAYGRDFFDWSVQRPTLDDLERGSIDTRRLEGLDVGRAEVLARYMLEVLRPWVHRSEIAETRGGSGKGSNGRSPPRRAHPLRGRGRGNIDDRALGLLHQWVLPDELTARFAEHKVRHVRIIPHGPLYGVPFGRLRIESRTLGQRFSLSLHPTANLAVTSAEHAEAQVVRPAAMAVIGGPPTDDEPPPDAAYERRAVQRASGVLLRSAVAKWVDGITAPRDAVVAKLNEFHLYHFLCHGRDGTQHHLPHLLLGCEGEGLDAAAIARLNLSHCALVFLQSCSTGWLDHAREWPVQGIPMAFCDAGARAVIAPLIKIRASFAAPFSSVFYRALRFLPAEVALQRALDLMRKHGEAVMRTHPETRDDVAEYGASMDRFEYRYIGATGITLGTWLSRAVGRIAFAGFVLWLRWEDWMKRKSLFSCAAWWSRQRRST